MLAQQHAKPVKPKKVFTAGAERTKRGRRGS
jgi:hypothetical protein